MNDRFDSPEYRRSRNAYTAQCAVEYFVSILVTDAYLAKLLKDAGFSDAMVGVVSSLVSFSFLFQLLAILLMQRMKNVKKTVVVFDTLSQLFFLALYILPFLPIPQGWRTALVFLFILAGYFCMYLINSLYFRWANSYVHPDKRGDFSATKEMISLLTGIVFTLGMGFAVDRFEAAGKLHTAFLFLGAVMLILNVCNFVCLLNIQNDSGDSVASQRKSFSEVIDCTFRNRSFRNVVVMTVLWDTARYLTIGFLGVYKTEDLMFTVGTVQLINMAANLFRFVLSRPFGRYSDRTSYARGFCLAMGLAAAGFAVNVFTMPSTRWLILLYTILYNVSLAGTNQNSYNITYSYVDSGCIVQAMAIKNSIGGLCGFGASLLGSKILAAVQANGNTLFGLPLHGQQLLSAVSFVLTVIAILFTRRVVEKQPVMRQ